MSNTDIQTIITTAGIVQSTLDLLNAQLATAQSQVLLDLSAIADLKKQIAAVSSRLGAALTAIPVINGGLHARLPWNQNGNVGNTGGGSGAKHGTYTETLDPGGASTTLSIVPSTGPNDKGFDNFYFDTTLPPPPSGLYRFIQHLPFRFPVKAEVTNSTATEFQLEWSDGVYLHNMAWQCLIGSAKPTWRYFKWMGPPTDGQWLDSGIPVDMATLLAGGLMDCYATFLADPAGYTTHEFLVINGVVHALNIVQPALAMNRKRYLQVGFQLDSKGCPVGSVPPPYSVSFACDELHVLVA